MKSSDYWTELRPSREGDEALLTPLWQAVFGDPPEFIAEFFRALYSPGQAVLALRDGELISAGFCIPGPLALGLRCSYIYAMATYAAHRGRGAAGAVARSLTRRAFEGGADVVALLPADDGLAVWYGRVLGMAPAFKKGGEGVYFPENWRRFSALCGGHDPQTPGRLWAVRRDGGGLSPLSALGWEHTLD